LGMIGVVFPGLPLPLLPQTAVSAI
jgi:hypothetical protein